MTDPAKACLRGGPYSLDAEKFFLLDIPLLSHFLAPARFARRGLSYGSFVVIIATKHPRFCVFDPIDHNLLFKNQDPSVR